MGAALRRHFRLLVGRGLIGGTMVHGRRLFYADCHHPAVTLVAQHTRPELVAGVALAGGNRRCGDRRRGVWFVRMVAAGESRRCSAGVGCKQWIGSSGCERCCDRPLGGNHRCIGPRRRDGERHNTASPKWASPGWASQGCRKSHEQGDRFLASTPGQRRWQRRRLGAAR